MPRSIDARPIRCAATIPPRTTAGWSSSFQTTRVKPGPVRPMLTSRARSAAATSPGGIPLWNGRKYFTLPSNSMSAASPGYPRSERPKRIPSESKTSIWRRQALAIHEYPRPRLPRALGTSVGEHQGSPSRPHARRCRTSAVGRSSKVITNAVCPAGDAGESARRVIVDNFAPGDTLSRQLWTAPTRMTRLSSGGWPYGLLGGGFDRRTLPGGRPLCRRRGRCKVGGGDAGWTGWCKAGGGGRARWAAVLQDGVAQRRPQ